jgi:hypothetical protein
MSAVAAPQGPRAVLAPFTAKHVQGLYSYSHFEAPDGAWVQIPIGGRGDVVYCASPSHPFKRFPTLAALADYLEQGA